MFECTVTDCGRVLSALLCSKLHKIWKRLIFLADATSKSASAKSIRYLLGQVLSLNHRLGAVWGYGLRAGSSRSYGLLYIPLRQGSEGTLSSCWSFVPGS